MELTFLKNLLNVVNPWIESVVVFLLFVFLVIIVARLLSALINKLLHYFDINNEYFPEFFEFATYVAGLAIMLVYAGIFKLALILLLGFIVLMILLALLFTVYGIIPDYLAGLKIKNRKLEVYGKNYSSGPLHTTYKISEFEKLVVPNNKLLNDLNRRLN